MPTPSAGYANAVSSQVGPTLEIIRTISPPADWIGRINAVGLSLPVPPGRVNAVGYAASVSRPITVTGLVGSTNAVGYTGSVSTGDGPFVGSANAVTAETGPTVEIIRTIAPPADWVGDINANGFAATISTQSGSITNISAGVAGRVNVTGYAPFTSLDVLPGEVSAVGYAPTVEIASRNPVGSVGKANATGYAAQVLRDKTVTAQLGRINVEGKLGASFNTEQNTIGKANAVSAETGPTIEIVKFTAFDQTAGEAEAGGFAPTIDFALGNITSVTSVGEARGNAVGYAPTVDFGTDIVRTPLVGKANATGLTPSVGFGGTNIIVSQLGRINAIHAATTATIEREKTIEGPFVGKANFTGRPPNTSTETPNIYNANGTVGTINLVGYEGDTSLSREALPTVGVVNAVGYSPDETEQPSTGAANAVGYAASVGIERTVRPQLGVVQTDGSIAVVEVQRGTYERVIGLGTVHAIGNRAKFQADVIKTDVDYGAGSGGKYYDDLMRQIRQEDELLLEMIEDFIRRVA